MSDIYAGRTARKHWAGVELSLIAAARDGRNRWCVDCGNETLAYGLRCLPCFSSLVAARRAA